MIISNCIRKIFRTWCRNIFELFIFLFIILEIESCDNVKHIAADTNKSDSLAIGGKQLPGELSIAPNHFRAEAVIADKSVTDSKPPQFGYSFFILNVLERGSSLTYAVTSGETIHTELRKVDEYSFQKGDTVIAFVEERLQLNADQPLFLLKDIHKK